MLRWFLSMVFGDMAAVFTLVAYTRAYGASLRHMEGDAASEALASALLAATTATYLVMKLTEEKARE